MQVAAGLDVLDAKVVLLPNGGVGCTKLRPLGREQHKVAAGSRWARDELERQGMSGREGRYLWERTRERAHGLRESMGGR